MKHAKRLSLIEKNPRPRGFRKIVVDAHEYWWKTCRWGTYIKILDSQTKKTIVDIHWNNDYTVTPKFVSEVLIAYNKTVNKEKYLGFLDNELFHEIVELSKDEK